MAASKQNKGLGKGLGALFGDLPPIPEPRSGTETPQTLPLQKIEPNPGQPRQDFDPEELQALADSIAQHGIIQPLTVRPQASGFYQIIAGERRWRAARMAGLKEIPVYILDADDKTVMELALIENLQRSDLNPMEEALGFKALIEGYNLTQDQVAERVGRSRPAVSNALRLLALPEDIAEMVCSGELSAGHARAVLMIHGKKAQADAARKIITLQLSVRQAESMCRRLSQEKPEKPKPLQVNYVEECAKTLSTSLGRGVHIVPGKRKGRVELEFYGEDDLQVLYEALLTLQKRKEGRK